MNHLSSAELVDAAEGTLPSARGAHLARCERCGAEVTTLRTALESARTADAPEPSPLYWTHLSARIRDRVSHEAIQPAWRAGWRDMLTVPRLAPAASALLILAVLFAAPFVTRGPAVIAPNETSMAGAAPMDANAAAQDSEAWDVLISAADETPLDEVHAAGMAATAGAVEGAVQRLTPAEQSALRDLLQTELRRSGD